MLHWRLLSVLRLTTLLRSLLLVGLALALLIISTPQPAHAEEHVSAALHTVAWGETVGTIAQKYGVSADSIITANHLTEPDRLFAGAQLVIPNAIPAPAPAMDNTTHVIQPGETLFGIALAYGVSTADLQAANGLASADIIYYGQVLIIPTAGYANTVPAATPTGGMHIVQPGETLMRISQQYGVSMQSIVSANGLINPSVIYVGQVLTIPGSSAPAESAPPPAAETPVTTTHIVQPGETLGLIAQNFGVSMALLVQANNLSNPSLLFVGQTLIIPGGGTSDSPAAQPVPSQGGTYTVQRGDTLFRIAVAYSVSVWDLMVANGLGSSLIYTGQVLTIPAGGSSTPAPAPDPVSAPPPTTVDGKQIVIVLSEQKTYAYENGVLLREFVVSTGLPATPTVLGDFNVYLKYDAQRMSGPGYDLPGVPWVMYFYQGYALHGTYWHNNFGHPMSHGCVNLRTPEAEWLYMWAPIGTPVHVQW
jgi:LysM repeat protein